MDWKDVGKAVANMAPLLGGALLGPPGAAAGGAIKILANGLGLSPGETTPSAAMSIIGTEEGRIKILELENTYKLELARINLEYDRLALQDVAGAREREMEIVKATGTKDINLYILSWTVVIGFFVLIGLLMRFPLPSGSNEVVFLLFGSMASGFLAVLQYFFGSSKSSQDKTKILVNQKPR